MAVQAENEELPPLSAGSGLEAARKLRQASNSEDSWKLKPSVCTWLPGSKLQDRARAENSTDLTEEEDAVQLGVKMHNRVAPWMWCVDEPGFDRFLEIVRQAHADGLIPNDPDPSTGLENRFHDHPMVGPNMHAVNKYVIIPRTHSAGGMSWALMDRPSGLPISFFVTHSWKEGVYEFYRKVRYSWPAGMAMWCCFLANPQSWPYSDLRNLLGTRDDLSDSPFMQALSSQSIQRFLVVPNCSESLYRRLWCVAELKKAMEIEIESGKPFIFVARDPLPSRSGVRHKDSISTMIAEATCSDENDKTRIKAFIHGHEASIEEMIVQIANGRRQLTSTTEAGSDDARDGESRSGAEEAASDGAADTPAGAAGAPPPAPILADFESVVSKNHVSSMFVVPPSGPPTRRHSDTSFRFGRASSSSSALSALNTQSSMEEVRSSASRRRNSTSIAEARIDELENGGSKGKLGMGTWIRQKVAGLWSPRPTSAGSTTSALRIPFHDKTAAGKQKYGGKEDNAALLGAGRADDEESHASDLGRIAEQDDSLFGCDLLNI